jgi:type IV secretion system protein VirD4
VNAKKIILPNLPYVFIALYGTKIGQAVRLAPGNDFSAKALNIMEGFIGGFSVRPSEFPPA